MTPRTAMSWSRISILVVAAIRCAVAQEPGCESEPINVIFQAAPVVGESGLNDVPELFAGAAREIPLPRGDVGSIWVGIVSQFAAEGQGMQGWSLSIGVEGALPVDATTKGTVAELAPAGRRVELSFEFSSLAREFNGDGKGVISAVVLGLVEDVQLPLEGTATVLRIDVEAPAGEFTGAVRCMDGFTALLVAGDGRGGTPIAENLFTVGGASREMCGCTEAVLTPLPFANFLRGDANDDGRQDIADAIRIIGALFRGGPAIPCRDAGDANDDGIVDLTDAILLIDFQLRDGRAPPEPFPACGPDPTDDTGDLDPDNDLDCPPGAVTRCR